MTRRVEVRRIEGGEVDEVLLYDGDECIFHLEQMEDNYWWFALYPAADDPYGEHFLVSSRRKISVTQRETVTRLTESPTAE